MKNYYELYYNYEDNTLEIIKIPSKNPVQTITGKYGIEFQKDINGHIVAIIVPEPEILFGIKQEEIETFLMYSL